MRWTSYDVYDSEDDDGDDDGDDDDDADDDDAASIYFSTNL